MDEHELGFGQENANFVEGELRDLDQEIIPVRQSQGKIMHLVRLLQLQQIKKVLVFFPVYGTCFIQLKFLNLIYGTFYLSY